MISIIELVKPYVSPCIKKFVVDCREKFKFGLLYLTYVINSPFLTSFFWIAFSKDIVKSGTGRGFASLIVFDSPGGQADIMAAFGQKDEHYRIICIDGEIIKHLFKYIVGENYCDYDYALMIGRKTKELNMYHKYLSEMTCNLQKKINLKAYINFNFVYHAQRELMTVANELGVKFITVMKECLRTEGYLESTVQVYKEKIGRIYPSVVFVHNEQTLELIDRSGIYSSGRVEIVGQARSDMLHHFYDSTSKHIKHPSDSYRLKRILYFAISETAGLPYFGHQSYFINNKNYLLPKNFNWSDVASSALKSLVEYCEQNTEVELIVKGKPSGVYSEYDAKNKRISYIHGNPDIKMLLDMDVVVGMNTTGLFESVAAGLPTISAELGIKRDLVTKRYLYDLNDVVAVATNKTELFNMLDLYLSSGCKININAEKELLLDKYLGNADGLAGPRLRQAIFEHLT